MTSARPVPSPPVPDFTVTRKDWLHRSRVHLNCRSCGTTTIRCAVGDADIYEQGFREHACGPLASIDLSERPALARMFLHTCGGKP